MLLAEIDVVQWVFLACAPAGFSDGVSRPGACYEQSREQQRDTQYTDLGFHGISSLFQPSLALFEFHFAFATPGISYCPFRTSIFGRVDALACWGQRVE
jgi:hypothetical protein